MHLRSPLQSARLLWLTLFLIIVLPWLWSPKPRHSITIPASQLAWSIDLNQAQAGELALLPEIGMVRAQAIVAFRNQYGAFQKLDDLSKVRGIGIKTVARLKSYPYLCIGNAKDFEQKNCASSAPRD